MEIGAFARAMQDYCLAFSASVTSWIRSPDHNARVGGVPTSYHIRGIACDVVYDGASPGDTADAMLARRGLQRIREGDHDHIQPFPGTA